MKINMGARLISSLCVIAGLTASSVYAQVGAITVVGSTTAKMDALAFNSSGTLYGTTAASLAAGSLYTINTSTGAATLVGPLVDASNASLTYAITGLAFQPGTGTLFGVTSPNSATSPQFLVTVDPSNGHVTSIGAENFSDQQAADITFTSNGTLYGWMEPDYDGLATLNLTTGQATAVGTSGYDTYGSGIAANGSDVLYYAGFGTGDVLSTVSKTDGTLTTVGTLTGGVDSEDSIPALAFSPGGVLYGIENSGSSAAELIRIGTSAAPPPPATPAPPALLLTTIGIGLLGLYLVRGRLAGMVRG